MDAVGYEKFREGNSKQTVGILLQRVLPPALKFEILQTVKYDPALERRVPKFTVKLESKAITCQEYEKRVKGGHKLEEFGRAEHSGDRGGNVGQRILDGHAGKRRHGHRKQSHENGAIEPSRVVRAPAELPSVSTTSMPRKIFATS